MAKVELKKPVVEEISSKIQGAQSVVLATYSGITVEQDTALRKEMREAGVEYKVYKNTMMNFAFKGTACEELCKHLDGPNALAISKDDATAPARILAKYAKDVKAVKLVAGVVEDKYYDEAGIKALADIPAREVLLGRLLGSLLLFLGFLGGLGNAQQLGGFPDAVAVAVAQQQNLPGWPGQLQQKSPDATAS